MGGLDFGGPELLVSPPGAETDHVYAVTPVALCLLDRELRFLRVNQRCAELDGLPVSEHIGRTVREILPKALADDVEPLVRGVFQSAQPVHDLELEEISPTDPDRRMVGLVSLHPIEDEQGRVQAVTVVIQDITTRKRAEQALAASQRRLAAILDSAMDAIVAIDGNGRIVHFNDSAARIFGCSVGEALGTEFDRFTTPELQEFIERCRARFDRDGDNRRCVWAPGGLRAVRSDGESYPIEATISLTETEGGRFLTLILRDVNDLERAERESARLREVNLYLQEEVRSELHFGEIVGRSPALKQVMDVLERAARSDSTVLLIGETGTGKELFARAIHCLSDRKDQVMVKVNCAAVPGSLIESEFFGHEKGAFTGATGRRIGRFETAHKGTILLDEIGDLPLELQSKFLRVLQEGEFERVGSTETIRIDCRILASTNRDLERAVAEGRFREDLYYRLNVVPIHIPPLRERPEDIPLLARYFVMRFAARAGKRIGAISPEIERALGTYSWPGNVRELQNVIERAVILSQGVELELIAWPPRQPDSAGHRSAQTLEEVERRHIQQVLERTGWRVSGEHGAARILGLKPTTLESRMKRMGLRRPV